ncbi:tRNA dihydrouridine(20/20a) synthase DusA [Alishewanella sp. SMS8]|uniref:tRNA dihydrouridine(20/20a) synthase DusA n=1 Tax=unclassified Alishewanella TaxID=2628974 RepID=UPI0027422343|nr:tRNA dihydrouridine(20/20a) synthase DusA [Alishewanella sp. SMS8]MDP4944610.1 tRNA dihydrouridine(20/20a) synthase DusA [Alishewanella sp.]MDP5207028.1 tRNA dihydrouridine(20/20a) synthase DusA [Alishewanella sp. SMS9]MDP5036781.1 tRNA dihydrouridine(20/20a) synthase DusA [Alishewanella sp.]MDP5188095.1 tRNA dihydrouridine(20/20a) synthase DusA [Alishewanella sp.]MDP5458673.1 tRNA dihydrouridine(20/20a) synthase DusA [Alishewanella sp. SMS8]
MTLKLLPQRLSVAPMLDWTDQHCRYFHRLMSQHAVLYTEMVTTGAIIHGKGDYLGYNEQEHPLVLQLGGSVPKDMATCAKLAEQRGYDAININVGCPSDRVQNGMFGACLMAQPQLVADCVKAMQDQVAIPITVKTRIGIDDSDEYQFLQDFVQIVADAGCQQFVIHARKAWLKGLSPKENREVPPLNYGRVYQLKQDFPALDISINGGIKTLAEAATHLKQLDGVMIGREAYTNPYMLSEVDAQLYGDAHPVLSQHQLVRQMLPYIEQQMQQGARFWHIARHMLGLFQGLPGARQWRRLLSEQGHLSSATPTLLEAALAKVPE